MHLSYGDALVRAMPVHRCTIRPNLLMVGDPILGRAEVD